MKIECAKPNITEYDFLRLFLSTTTLKGNAPIFESQQLQNDLYAYSNKPQFSFLFEDICKKERIGERPSIDLSTSLQQAYTWGLLSSIQVGYRLKSIISLTQEESQEILHQYAPIYKEAMSELVDQLSSKKEEESFAFTKKIKR